MDSHKKAYIKSMNKKETQAYNIAKSFLKSSFDLEKSLGYKAYCKKNPPKNAESKNKSESKAN